MSKFTRIKLELAKMLAKFSDIKTDKAVLTWDSDEDLRAGMDVYVQDENGEYKPAEDGEYVTEDGKTIVVKDGKVESVTDPKAEVDPEEAAKAEVDAACGKRKVETAEEPVDPEVATDGDKETVIDAIHREINELYDIVDKLVKKVAELEGKSEATEKTVEKMSKMSAAFSAEEQIEGKASIMTGNPVIDKKLKNIQGMFE
jgi:hypothetical protein|nr:MAG TPA: hypothetical protein [Caudoviricetes sp.]